MILEVYELTGQTPHNWEGHILRPPWRRQNTVPDGICLTPNDDIANLNHVLPEYDAILFRQTPGASGWCRRAAADASDRRGDHRQIETVAETVVHRSGQLFGREIARHTVFSLGTAASADGADGDETPLRHLLSIEADRGSAGTIEFTDCPALFTAGTESIRNAGDFATSAGRRCD